MRHAPIVLLLALGAAALAGCRSEPLPPDAAAQVGSAVLTLADLDAALSVLPPGTDSTFARRQVVEQWVSTQLLAHEAGRRGLRDTPEVQQLLAESERQILADAMLSALYDEHRSGPSSSEIQAYYERHRDRLRLREPFVRVRFVETRAESQAEAARQAMQDAMRSGGSAAARDSLFALTARRFAADTTSSLALADSYIPQARLTRQSGPAPWGIVAQMGPGEISPVLAASDSSFLVVQLVDRVPAGAEPELAWIEDEVRRRLLIQHRQQAIAREVERLRLEAEARGDLRVNLPEDA